MNQDIQTDQHRHKGKPHPIVITLLAILNIALLVAIALMGSEILHERQWRESFPVRHALGDAPVLQLQALYKEDPYHADKALKAGHNPHIRSQVTGTGIENRNLVIDIDTNGVTLKVDRPYMHQGKDTDGHITGMASLIGIGDDYSLGVFLIRGQKPSSPDTEAEWQHGAHMSKQQGIALAQQWTRTMLDTAADNW